MRSSSSETRLRGAGDGTWHSLSCQPGFGDFSSVLRALGDRFARASIWPVFNYRAPQGPLSAVPRRDRCASGRRERASTTRPPLVAPLDARPRGAPPSPSYMEKPDGGGMVPGSRERGRGRGRDDSECLLATPTTPALVRDTRRVSEVCTGVRCARCVCSVVVLASRPRGASNGPSQRRLSDVSAPDAAEYARANEVLCGALWPQPASQQALQRVSVSLLHMLAADLGAAFGAAASVPPVGGAWTIASSVLGLRAAGGAGPY